MKKSNPRLLSELDTNTTEILFMEHKRLTAATVHKLEPTTGPTTFEDCVRQAIEYTYADNTLRESESTRLILEAGDNLSESNRYFAELDNLTQILNIHKKSIPEREMLKEPQMDLIDNSNISTVSKTVEFDLET